MITIDASVFVAAVDPADPNQGTASRFLAAVASSGEVIHQPTLTLVEVTASLARRSGDEAAAMEAGAALLSMPGLVVHPLDLEAAADASAIAVRSRVRGADAIYAATAMARGATLVTLDHELLARVADLVTVTTPAGWLEARGSDPAQPGRSTSAR